MHLQAEASVFDDVGIHEAGDDAFPKQSFAQALRQDGGEIGGTGFGVHLQDELMLAGVGGWIFRAEQCRAKPLSVAKPEKKTDEGTAQEGRDEEQAYRSPCD